jgi:uncharacterized membrane protein
MGDRLEGLRRDQSARRNAAALADAGKTYHVVSIVLEGTHRADEVLTGLHRLVADGRLCLADAVVVVKSGEGRTRVRETTDPTPLRGAVSGAGLGTLVGLLFGGPVVAALAGAATGALYGRLVDVGLDDAWVSQMADWIDPGTSALLLLIEEAEMKDEVVRVLGRCSGRLVTTTLPASVRQALVEAGATGHLDWPAPSTEGPRKEPREN